MYESPGQTPRPPVVIHRQTEPSNLQHLSVAPPQAVDLHLVLLDNKWLGLEDDGYEGEDEPDANWLGEEGWTVGV